MNEQIQKLALEAKLGKAEFDNGVVYYVATQETFNKFSELLIRKCADITDTHEPLNTWTKRYSTLIREHFGVEE